MDHNHTMTTALTNKDEKQLVWLAMTRPDEQSITPWEVLALFCHASRGMWSFQELARHHRLSLLMQQVDGWRLYNALDTHLKDTLYHRQAVGGVRHPAAYLHHLVAIMLFSPPTKPNAAD